MKVYTLHRKITIQRPLVEVFPFFADPENLRHLTPPSLAFFILTPPPIIMRAGALISYTIRILGIRLRWKTIITAYDPPWKFVDEQLKGPYSRWQHTHTFSETNGTTTIEDHVRYALPFGLLGRMVHTLVVRRQIEQIFNFRAEAITNLFSGALLPEKMATKLPTQSKGDQP